MAKGSRVKRLLTLWLVFLLSPVKQEADSSNKVVITPQEIEMGGTFQSCIQGLGPGMSVDVWYLRPGFDNPEVQFDWQEQACQRHTFNTGWIKDVGIWNIVSIRLHKEGDYQAPWRKTDVMLKVLPDAELRPEFEALARRQEEIGRAARRLLAGGVLFLFAFCIAPAILVQRLIK